MRLQCLAFMTALAVTLPMTAAAQLGLQPGSGPRVSVERLLRAEAGERTVLRRTDEGRVRLAYGMRLTTRGATPVERARHVLHRYQDLFGLYGVDVRGERVLEAHGYTVVRFTRHAFGRELLGASIIVRLNRDGVADLVWADIGSLREDASPAEVAVSAVAQQAVARMGDFEQPQAVETRQLAMDTGALVIRAFAVEVQGLHASQRAELYFDARDGTYLAGRSLVQHATGRVWDPNPVVADDMTSDVELNNLTSARFLTGRYVRVQSCPATGSSCTTAQRAEADADGNFLFEPMDPSFADPFAEVNVYFHTDRVAAYFRDVHDFTWSCCGTSSVMDAIANYTETPGLAFDNAFFSPGSCGRGQCPFIALGQGASRDFGYDGDVIYHEYGHGIVDLIASIVGFDLDPLLGVTYEPLAVNEGTADYFSAAVTDDPRMSEYFTGLGGGFGAEGSLRNLDNDLRCPDDLFGEGHADGNIWSGTGWDVRLAIGEEKADPLVFLALMATPSNPDLSDAGDTLLATAMTLEADGALTTDERIAVDTAVSDRGLLDCSPIVPLDDGAEHLGYSGSEFQTGMLGSGVAPLHYRIDIPADATRLTIDMRKLTFAGRYGIYLRAGQPGRFVNGRTPPLVVDAEFPNSTSVEITNRTDYALPRCETLYIGLEVEDLLDSGQSVYGITATLETSGDPGAPCPEPMMDAGVPPEDAGAADSGEPPADGGLDAAGDGGTMGGGGGGCGCRVTASVGGTSAAALLGVLLPLALLLRRRR